MSIIKIMQNKIIKRSSYFVHSDEGVCYYSRNGELLQTLEVDPNDGHLYIDHHYEGKCRPAKIVFTRDEKRRVVIQFHNQNQKIIVSQLFWKGGYTKENIIKYCGEWLSQTHGRIDLVDLNYLQNSDIEIDTSQLDYIPTSSYYIVFSEKGTPMTAKYYTREGNYLQDLGIWEKAQINNNQFPNLQKRADFFEYLTNFDFLMSGRLESYLDPKYKGKAICNRVVISTHPFAENTTFYDKNNNIIARGNYKGSYNQDKKKILGNLRNNFIDLDLSRMTYHDIDNGTEGKGSYCNVM